MSITSPRINTPEQQAADTLRALQFLQTVSDQIKGGAVQTSIAALEEASDKAMVRIDAANQAEELAKVATDNANTQLALLAQKQAEFDEKNAATTADLENQKKALAAAQDQLAEDQLSTSELKAQIDKKEENLAAREAAYKANLADLSQREASYTQRVDAVQKSESDLANRWAKVKDLLG